MTPEMTDPLGAGADHVGGTPEEEPMPYDAGARAQLHCQCSGLRNRTEDAIQDQVALIGWEEAPVLLPA